MSRKHIATVRVLELGRVTIPSEIRDVEGIKKGDYVQITIQKILSPKDSSKSDK